MSGLAQWNTWRHLSRCYQDGRKEKHEDIIVHIGVFRNVLSVGNPRTHFRYFSSLREMQGERSSKGVTVEMQFSVHVYKARNDWPVLCSGNVKRFYFGGDKFLSRSGHRSCSAVFVIRLSHDRSLPGPFQFITTILGHHATKESQNVCWNFFLGGGGWSGTESTVSEATTGLLYQPWMMSVEKLVERLAGEAEVLGEMPQCRFVYHKSHMSRPGPPRGNRRLTAWTTARPKSSLASCIWDPSE
jgi:hypothetical protein